MQLAPRERQAANYNQKLKEKFQHHPQIRRIAHHRHLPKNIYHQTKELRVMKEARRRKYVFIIFGMGIELANVLYIYMNGTPCVHVEVMVTWAAARVGLTYAVPPA